MAKAPAPRARVRRTIKKGKKVARPRRTLPRRAAGSVLAQGAMGGPRRSFGGKVRSSGGKRYNMRAVCHLLDARIPNTIGLPKAVGPYTIIRTTTLHQSSANVLIFAPFRRINSGLWFPWAGVEDVISSNGVTAVGNLNPILLPMGSLIGATEVVPAALTVQVMNPASLQLADGVYTMGRVNQQLELGGAAAATPTWDDIAQRVISNYAPRVLTGGKLALKGVVCHTFPLDMTQYCDFGQLDQVPLTQWEAFLRPAALAPIFFSQRNAVPQTIEFMVTMEWRVRFDPLNPATSSHTHHNTTSDAVWNGVMRSMSSAGHGVVDLGEDVLESGAIGAGLRAGVMLL